MNSTQVRRGVLWFALCLLLVCTAYGVQHYRLLQQDIWTHDGLKRFLLFAAGYAAFFLLLFAVRPAYLPAAAGMIAILFTLAAAGLIAVLTVLLVLLASFALGQKLLSSAKDSDLLATLLGLAVYMFLLSLAAPFQVNYWFVYACALALPLGWNWRAAAHCIAKTPMLFRPLHLSRTEQLASAALIFVLSSHLLVALQPEVGPDALAVHLAVPDSMAWLHRWPFDVTQHLWAVMPMDGDWSFSLCDLLGGEAAARLFNFALLLGIAALLLRGIRKWLPLASALLLVALFAATPLVQLVTGSLFVENLWAVLCLGALIAVDLYRERGDPRFLYLAFVLLGAAGATKFGALAFAPPFVLIACWIAWKRSPAARIRHVATALLCFAVFLAPPYVGAFIKTGSPVFPYMPRAFPSRYPVLAAGVGTPPPGEHLSLNAFFDLTFHTSRFYEVQDGATGFQYFVLLPLGLLLLSRKWPPLAVESGIVFVLFGSLTLAIMPDVRYLYPALGPATLFLSAAVAELKKLDRALSRLVTALLVGIFCFDLYFFPSSGWMHKDFVVNPASPSVRARYLAAYAPERALIADLNRTHPGAPTAFFASNADAGLRAPAFTASWHTPEFNQRISTAASAADCYRVLQDYAVRFVIAPLPGSGIRIDTTPEETFLRRCTEPEFTSGKFYAGRLRESCTDRDASSLAAAGQFDDSDARIDFHGLWSRGPFPQAANGTLTWSASPGAAALLRFDGSEVTYVYTKAFNRGMAEIFLDGASQGTLDLYSATIDWKTATVFRAARPGAHTFEVRVTGRKSPAATGSFVDVDQLIVH